MKRIHEIEDIIYTGAIIALLAGLLTAPLFFQNSLSQLIYRFHS